MNERQAQETLRKIEHIFQAAQYLGDALDVAAQAKERGDKLELRVRELAAQKDAKEAEVTKLAETLLAAEAAGNDYLAKRRAERDVLDQEYAKYKQELKGAYEMSQAEHDARLAELRKQYEAEKVRMDAEHTKREAEARTALAVIATQIKEHEVKRAELMALVAGLRDKLARV
jgi:hypothetical protein